MTFVECGDLSPLFFRLAAPSSQSPLRADTSKSADQSAHFKARLEIDGNERKMFQKIFGNSLPIFQKKFWKMRIDLPEKSWKLTRDLPEKK